MGWVVYDTRGNLVKYYKKPGPAKAAVTRYHKAMEAGGYSWPEAHACCTYRDFEGVLLGLEGAELKMWQFCNTKNG
jgi:hypothetical protein